MRLALLGCLVILLCPSLSAQEDSSRVRKLKLTDGSEFIGRVLEEDASAVKFKTLSGVQMSVERRQIKSMEVLEGEESGGGFMTRDPNETRLFFSATGRALKQGKGYFSAYEIFFPFLAVGVTDFITIGGGMTLFPGATAQLFYFTPKVRLVHFENLDVSTGLLYTNIFGSGAGGGSGAGIYYGVGTYGTQQVALTAGLGWGFAGGDVANKPVLMVGAEVGVGGSAKLISENWFPPNTDTYIYSFGIRFFGERIAGDFGFITLGGVKSGFPFFPWVGFAYNF